MFGTCQKTVWFLQVILVVYSIEFLLSHCIWGICCTHWLESLLKTVKDYKYNFSVMWDMMFSSTLLLLLKTCVCFQGRSETGHCQMLFPLSKIPLDLLIGSVQIQHVSVLILGPLWIFQFHIVPGCVAASRHSLYKCGLCVGLQLPGKNLT